MQSSLTTQCYIWHWRYSAQTSPHQVENFIENETVGHSRWKRRCSPRHSHRTIHGTIDINQSIHAACGWRVWSLCFAHSLCLSHFVLSAIYASASNEIPKSIEQGSMSAFWSRIIPQERFFTKILNYYCWSWDSRPLTLISTGHSHWLDPGSFANDFN